MHIGSSPQEEQAERIQRLLQGIAEPTESSPDSLPVRTQAAQNVQQERSLLDRLQAIGQSVGEFAVENNPLVGFGPEFAPGERAIPGLVPVNIQADTQQLLQEGLGPAERFIQGPLEGLFRTLNEFARPQQALFAGARALQEGMSFDEAFSITADEFGSGFGSGIMKRDVTFGDLLFPDTPREERSGLQQVAGLTGDIVVDPINIGAINRLPRMAVNTLQSVAQTGISISRNISPRAVNDALDASAAFWKKLFIVPDAQTQAGRQLRISQRTLDSYGDLHRRDVYNAYRQDQRTVKSLADELGTTTEEIETAVRRHVEFGPGAQPSPIPEHLENTLARIYNEAGVSGVRRFMQSAGLRELRDERPLRRAIFDQSFDEKEADLLEQYGPEAMDRLKGLAFDLRERRLERMWFEASEKAFTDLDSPQGKMFESLKKDYLSLIATDDFRTAVANLPGAPYSGPSGRGFSFNPFHTSELASELQDKGINEANRLLQTPRRRGSSESMFRLKNPETGEFVHLPLMEKGFETDPFYIDAIRTYYGRQAVEASQMMDDLVRGFGRVLDDADFVPAPRKVREGSVQETAPGRLQARPGQAATEPVFQRRLTKEAAEKLEDEGMGLIRGVRGFENAVLPKEAADLISEATSLYNDVSRVDEVARMFSLVQNQVWKPWTLFVYPEFHARNTVSNAFLMNIGGVPAHKIPKYVARGVMTLIAGAPPRIKQRLGWFLDESGEGGVGTIAGDMRKLPPRIQKLLESSILLDPTTTLTKQSRELRELLEQVDVSELVADGDMLPVLRLMVDLGIVRGGEFGTAEVARTVEGALASARGGTLSKIRGLVPYASTADESPLLRGGMAIGSGIEDSMRAGMFLWAIEEGGMDILTAREHTLRHLIDFDRLTDFEKKWMRGVLMPFYAWARHSLPLMVENLIDEPRKWSAMNKIKRDIERQLFAEGEVPEERLLPEYVSRGAGVPARRAEDGSYQYFLFDDWIPQAQLAKIDTLDELMGFFPAQASSPIIRTVAELAFQKSLFLDAEFDLSRTEFAGFRMSPEMATVLRNARTLAIVDRFTRENAPAVMDNLVRLGTGINKIRLEEDRLQQSYAARISDFSRQVGGQILEIQQALEAGKISPEQAQREIMAAEARLEQFIQRGR